MRVRALAVRILKQLKNDRRTLALIFFAPVLLLSLLYFILSSSNTEISIGVVNAPEKFVDGLYDNNVDAFRMAEGDAFLALEKSELTAVVKIESGKAFVWVDGTNSSKASAALQVIERARIPAIPVRPDLATDVTYRYGSGDLTLFDTFSTTLIGFLTFFFVFLLSGIFFLKERTLGTLEKVLSTPIKRWEIVMGYVLGFGAVTLVQSLIIATFVVYVLGVMLAGSLWLVFLVTLLTAFNALSLGFLLSTLASTEFQMMQFIPIVAVPQVFFSGMFDLSPAFQAVARFVPMHYSASALNHVMMKGHGFSYILTDVCVLFLGSVVFMIINTRVLKKYRNI
jgi:ABC-2 type transport system permease protein